MYINFATGNVACSPHQHIYNTLGYIVTIPLLRIINRLKETYIIISL